MNLEKKRTLLLLCGGGSTEHEISLISASYLENCLKNYSQFEVITVEIGKDQVWRLKEDKASVELLFNRKLKLSEQQTVQIDLAIPCLHGFPGETGDIQSFLSLLKIPFFGSASEPHQICFNKVTTKLWLEALQISHTPFVFLHENNSLNRQKALDFFQQYGKVFVKAASQGSSVGCYPVENEKDLKICIDQAFQLSPYVILEKLISGRELEVSVYEFQGQIHASSPGEIVCPQKFYSYDEKYSKQSQTKTVLLAPGISTELDLHIKDLALRAFKALKLRHLARIDFFLDEQNQVYLNEINTIPGLTPISMFPKMLENHGPSFTEYLLDCLNSI